MRREHHRRQARDANDWPAHPLTAWHATERMASLLEEADNERQARTMQPQRTIVMSVVGIVRSARARIRAAIGATSGRGRRLQVEPATPQHRDPASI